MYSRHCTILRSDRSRTVRAVLADRVQTLDSAQLRELREASVPALQSALATLRTMSFPDQSAIVSEFDQRLNTVIRLHAESLAAMARPKGERPASLAKTIHDEMTAFIAFLDKFSVQLNRMVKLEDGFVDQLMEVKQLAWMVRDRGGDASVIVSNGMSGQPLPQDPVGLLQDQSRQDGSGLGSDVADGGRLADAGQIS